MSAFRRFEAAKQRHEATRVELANASEAINTFRYESAKTIEKLLIKFTESGLMPDFDVQRNAGHLYNSTDIGTTSFQITSTHMTPGDSLKDDKSAIKLLDEIIAAANECKIPVVKGEQNKLLASQHVKEAEKHPSILLNALGAYADSKGNTEMGDLARAGAAKLDAIVASLREIE